MMLESETAPAASFDEKLAALIAQTSYQCVVTERDRETVYRLRYEAYRRENAIGPRDDRRFTDTYDDDANAMVFLVRLGGEVAGSIRLHVTSRDQPFGPALDTYGDVLAPVLDAGENFIDPSRFVTNPSAFPGVKLLPFAVTRLACMAAEHFRANWMLATVRVEHAPFYRRFCNLRSMTPPRQYPCLAKPLMLLGERNDDIRQAVFSRYPVFSSTPAERARLFRNENVFADKAQPRRAARRQG